MTNSNHISKHPTPKVKLVDLIDPILLGDTVLSQLMYLPELNVDNLMQLSGRTQQSVKSVYLTELLIHISYLMNQGLNLRKIAELVGIDKDNISNNKRLYNLPQQFTRLQQRIDAKQEAKKQKQTTKWIQMRYKIQLLYQILEDQEELDNLKEVAKRSGLAYQKTRDWYSQYQLKYILKTKVLGTISEERSHEGSLEIVEKSTIQINSIHPSSRLFTASGSIILAEDLLEYPELLAEKYLMLDYQMNVHFGSIKTAKTKGVSSISIQTMSGGLITIDEDTCLISDQNTGLMTKSSSTIQNDESIVNIRHFKKLPTRIPSLFSLFRASPHRPEVAFVLNETVAERISTKLRHRFGTLKQCSRQLNIRYKHGLVARQYRHSELEKIVQAIDYPDVNHPDFMKDVTFVSYAIQGGQPISVDYVDVTDDLLYILGLIASDGYAMDKRKAVLGFNNKLKPLVLRFQSILQTAFPSLTTTIRLPRTKKVTYSIDINHYPLRMIMYNFMIKGDDFQFDENKAYFPIFQLPTPLITAFIRGLFDGDGHVDLPGWRVSIAVFHPQRAKNVQLLLKRLNIDSKVQYSFEADIQPPNSDPKDSDQWNVIIEGKKDIVKFASLIQPEHPYRGRKLEKMVQLLKSKNSLSSKYNFAPRTCSQLIRSLRLDAGLTQKKISNKSTYATFELGKSRKSIAAVRDYVDKLIKLGVDQTKLEFKQLQNLIKPVYNLDPIRRVFDHNKMNRTAYFGESEIREFNQPRNLISLETTSNVVIDTGIVVAGRRTMIEFGTISSQDEK